MIPIHLNTVMVKLREIGSQKTDVPPGLVYAWMVGVETGDIVTPADEAIAAVNPYDSGGATWQPSTIIKCRFCQKSNKGEPAHTDTCQWVESRRRVTALKKALKDYRTPQYETSPSSRQPSR